MRKRRRRRACLRKNQVGLFLSLLLPSPSLHLDTPLPPLDIWCFAEQKYTVLIPSAQMAAAFPLAKARLGDVKPPIADNAIYDSLYHYWFDVDKAVGWLRRDWEKKG
jgi:hypothetical protein